MMDTEAFREFKTGLTYLRDNYANKALPHMRRAVDLDKNNPYYMSYLGVVLARSEEHTSELQSRLHLVCRLLLEKKKKTTITASLRRGECRAAISNYNA